MTNRWVVYGPCSLGVVSVLSVGISGIRTEKRPMSELNLTHPPSLSIAAGVAGGFEAGGRRGECSWATIAALNANVSEKIATKRLMMKSPSKVLKDSEAYTTDRPQMTRV